LKSLFRTLINEFLIKRVGVKQELQRFAVDYIQGILVLKLSDRSGNSKDFHKAVALYQLMFIDTPSRHQKSGTRLAIMSEGATEQSSVCLFL